MRRTKRIIYGILLVLIGVAIALTATGVIDIPLPGGISVWRIVLGVLFLLAAVDRIASLDMVASMLMLGFEVMIFEEYIGTLIGKTEANWINNWLVLLIAIILGVGLDMVFKGFKGKKRRGSKKYGSAHAIFGDNLQYVDCSVFNYQYVSNRFGDTVVRFENTELYRGGGTLEIENTFGDVTVYVPSDWEVESKLTNSFGDISVSKKLTQHYADGSGKTLKIIGENRFGDVDIKAV